MKSKVASKFKKYILLLKLLKKNCKGNCDQNYRNIISYLDEDSLNFLSECIRNTLSPENISKLPKSKSRLLVKKVTPHKKSIKSVIKKKLSFKKRKKILQNGAGFFLPLLTTVIPLITSIANAISQ